MKYYFLLSYRCIIAEIFVQGILHSFYFSNRNPCVIITSAELWKEHIVWGCWFLSLWLFLGCVLFSVTFTFKAIKSGAVATTHHVSSLCALWCARIVFICMASSLVLFSGTAHLLHSNILGNSKRTPPQSCERPNLAWMERCHPAAWAKLSIVLLVSHWTTLLATVSTHPFKTSCKRMLPYPSESESSRKQFVARGPDFRGK